MRAPSHLRRNGRLHCALEALVKRNVQKRCQFYLYELSPSILVYFPRGVGVDAASGNSRAAKPFPWCSGIWSSTLSWHDPDRR
jgi:hypothetical protein